MRNKLQYYQKNKIQKKLKKILGVDVYALDVVLTTGNNEKSMIYYRLVDGWANDIRTICIDY